MSVMTAQAAMLFSAKNGISPAFRQMAGDAQKFGASASNSMKRASAGVNMLKGAVAGVMGYISIAAIANFGNKAIEAFKESEGAIANLEAGLKSTNYAIGLTSKELQNMASAWQGKTIFEDDAILQNTTAQLLTFGNIGKENFDRVQGAVMDVTAKLKGINATGDDLKNTSIMLGKALNDPAQGLKALRRVGISFSDAQVDMIKNMQASGKLLDAQNYMLKEIEVQYGGTAAALGGTAAGQIIIKQNEIGNSMERIGAVITPLKAQFLSFSAFAVEKIAIIVEWTQKWYTENKSTILGVIQGFKDFVKFIKFMLPVIISIGVGVLILKAYAIQIWAVTTATKLWAGAQLILNAILSANPIGLIIIGIAALIGIIVLLVMHWKEVSAVLMIALEWLKKNYDMFLLLLGPIGLVTNVIIGLVSRWGEVVAAFQAGGILGAIKQIGIIIFDSIIMPIKKVLALISKIPGVGKFASGASDSLSNMRNNLVAPNAQTAQAEISGRARVDVNFANAPQGTTATQRRIPRQAGNLDLSLAGAN